MGVSVDVAVECCLPWACSCMPISPTDRRRLLDEADEARICAILAGMTLREKLGQMFQINWVVMRPATGIAGWIPVPHESLAHNDHRPLGDVSVAAVSDDFLGSVLGGGGDAPDPNTPEAWRMQNASMQRAAAATPAGVPLLIGNDSVHGQNNLRGATLFPHHIGQGCMRNERGESDEVMVRQLAGIAARESHACGVNWLFTPCAAVPQDLRWGRTYEGFSEDPSIVSLLAAAEVQGVQSQRFPMAVPGEGCSNRRRANERPASAEPSVAHHPSPPRHPLCQACLKHWVGDGGTAYGTGTSSFFWTGAPGGVCDQGDCRDEEEVLRREHIAAYVPALRAGCLTVMASYSSWRGVALHRNRHLLTTVLKEELVRRAPPVTLEERRPMRPSTPPREASRVRVRALDAPALIVVRRGSQGFEGLVVSDYNGIGQLDGADYESKFAECICAGIDMVGEPPRPRASRLAPFTLAVRTRR